MKNFAAMTDAELNTRIRELSNILNGEINDDWDKAYKEYCQLTEIQNERYRLVNQEAFDAFYEPNIKGKAWEEIRQADWDFYSDWHKDMYGYRPRTI
jgi:hypothetical protein